MKFRYTFEKDFKKRVIHLSLITMSVYSKYIDSGHKVVKREIYINGKWNEII